MSAVQTHIPAPLQPPSADLREHARRVASWLGQEPLSVSFAFGAAGLARTATLTVRNLAGQACQGLFSLRVLVATDEEGTQGAQTLAVSHGKLVASVVANVVLDVLTDPDGTAAIGITLGGAGTRHVLVTVGGIVQGSGELVFV